MKAKSKAQTYVKMRLPYKTSFFSNIIKFLKSGMCKNTLLLAINAKNLNLNVFTEYSCFSFCIRNMFCNDFPKCLTSCGSKQSKID